MEKIKCVILGDQSVGKTSLISSYFQQKINESYNPTILEVFEIQSTLLIAEKEVSVLINLWDTPGDKTKFEDFNGLIYEGANIFIICFSLVDKNSLRSAINFWYNDQLVGVKGQLQNENTEVVFIGCQKDQKEIYLYDHKSNLVVQQAQRIFSQMGFQYYEICAFTQDNLKATFNNIFYHYYNKVMNLSPNENLNSSQQLENEQEKEQENNNKLETPTKKKCLIF